MTTPVGSRQIATVIVSTYRWVVRPQIMAGIIVLAVIGGSLMPADDARAMPGNDGFRHVIAYALLCFFAMRAFRSRGHTLLMPLGCLALGIVLEFLQPLVGRAFDVQDIVANGVGVLVGCSVVWLVAARS